MTARIQFNQLRCLEKLSIPALQNICFSIGCKPFESKENTVSSILSSLNKTKPISGSTLAIHVDVLTTAYCTIKRSDSNYGEKYVLDNWKYFSPVSSSKLSLHEYSQVASSFVDSIFAEGNPETILIRKRHISFPIKPTIWNIVYRSNILESMIFSLLHQRIKDGRWSGKLTALNIFKVYDYWVNVIKGNIADVDDVVSNSWDSSKTAKRQGLLADQRPQKIELLKLTADILGSDGLDVGDDALTSANLLKLRAENIRSGGANDPLSLEPVSGFTGVAVGKNEACMSIQLGKKSDSWSGTNEGGLGVKAPDNEETSFMPLSKKKNPQTGVVYVGRVPHGFYEEEMKAYFSQFGEILRLRLSRNKKTGKSKHYAFIEFESVKVAQVVAETMNNYLLFDHILQVKVIPQNEVHENLFQGANKKFKSIPHKLIAREVNDKKRTEEEERKLVKREKERRLKRNERLKALNIDYSFES